MEPRSRRRKNTTPNNSWFDLKQSPGPQFHYHISRRKLTKHNLLCYLIKLFNILLNLFGLLAHLRGSFINLRSISMTISKKTYSSLLSLLIFMLQSQHKLTMWLADPINSKYGSFLSFPGFSSEWKWSHPKQQKTILGLTNNFVLEIITRWQRRAKVDESSCWTWWEQLALVISTISLNTIWYISSESGRWMAKVDESSCWTWWEQLALVISTISLNTIWYISSESGRKMAKVLLDLVGTVGAGHINNQPEHNMIQ